MTFAGGDRELVALALADERDEDLPDTGGAHRPHRALCGVPAGEVTDHGNSLSVRGPDAEAGALHLTQFGGVGARVGAEDIEEALVAALTDEVGIDLTNGGEEGVAIGAGGL